MGNLFPKPPCEWSYENIKRFCEWEKIFSLGKEAELGEASWEKWQIRKYNDIINIYITQSFNV